MEMRQLFVFWQFNGDNTSACNLHCPECYGRKGKTYKHYWNGDAAKWEAALERLDRQHGDSGLYIVFSYGEALISKGFYDCVDMIGRHPTWTLNIISNFMADPTRLLTSKLVKDGRLFVTASWHPEGIDDPAQAWEVFKAHILQASAAGVPIHIMMVWMPYVIERFPAYFDWFDAHDFRVSVRRFVVDRFLNTVPFVRRLPWVGGTYTLAKYSKDEMKFLLASTSPKVTKYAINLANCRGKSCSAGKDMILIKHNGTATICAGCVAKRHEIGNIFHPNFKLNTENLRCPINSCGGDFGMLHLVDEEFGPLPQRLERDTFISQTELVKQGSPVPYLHRKEMLEAVEALRCQQ